MPSGNRGDGYRSYASGTYDPRSNGHRTHSYDQGSSHGNPNSGIVPTYADTTSRRRSMNIEDMLNHSDEDTRRYQQPQFRRSEAGRTVFRNPRTIPGSLQGNRAPRSGPQSHGANASARSRGGSHPPPTQGRGSASPDVPSRTRAARPAYSNEEKHFIWYLRIDVRIYRFPNSWPDPVFKPRGMSRKVQLFRQSHSSESLLEQATLTPKRLSSVGIPGLPSPRLSTLISLTVEKDDAKSLDCSAGFIGSQKPMAYRM